MADAGLFPKAPVEAVAEVEAPATTPAAPAAPAAPETQLTAPALDVVPPADVPENLVAATFGLLRAEPDGSVVIAGSGRPGSEVEVYSDDTLLGSTTVESSGDWVFVPDQPLPAGGVEITLAERGKEGRAAQSFVVVVNEDKSTQPLVVASAPGQASEVLQGLTRTDASATTAVATAEPAVSPTTAPAPVAVAVAPAAAPAATPATPVASPATPAATPAPTQVAQAPSAPEAPAAAPETPAPAPAATPLAAPAPAPATATAPAATPEAPAPGAVASAPAPATPAVPAATPAPPAASAAVPAAQLADVPPTIDAIEIEGDRTFFAGAGPEGGIVRLYVDDAFVADATIEGGRWLVEGGDVLDAPSQRVRADLLAAGSPDVVARAEVDFVVDMPAEEPATAVASADVAAPTPAPAPAAAPAAAPTPATTPAQPTAEPASPTAPAASTEAPAPVAATPAEPAATAPAQPSATPAAPAAQAATPAPATPAPEAPATPAPVAVAETPAAPQPTAAPAVPTMVAVAVGSPDAQRFASGKAIIRRGDNLWTIARRAYGEGIKYTTIYDANTGQIRDPDRIYPGQVFNLPQ
ncbi:LysM peptidoglycan-binding domain-containing protein [Devosia riboflavina]